MIETQVSIDIKMEYFALFRACTKKGEEAIRLESSDAVELYEQLRRQYKFPIERDRIHLVVNEEYSPWDKPLKSGDTVVFIPPVSGG